MENSFQTSFIPKKPIATINGTQKASRPPTSIFTVLAFLLLIITGVFSGGLFLYKNYLIKQKEVLSSSLERVRDSFEKDTIDELELYDKRVSAAKQVLSNHIVLSPMFALLGSLTIPAVQYTSFSHQSTNQGFSVELSALALDYRSIALQADAFNTAKGRSFKNVIFSNLNKDNKTGMVTFDIDFTVDPALLSYEKNLLLEQVEAKMQTPAPGGVNDLTPLPEAVPSTNNNPIP